MATGVGRFYKWFLLIVLVGILVELAAIVSVLRGDDDGEGNIAVVEIRGPISASHEAVQRLKKFEDDAKAKAIVVRVDSPGGTVAASQEIHDEIARIAKKKKVVVSMGDVAASGGYYLAAAADKIVANPGTLTGSIGVIASYFVFDELLKKFNVKWEVIAAGGMKDIGSPLRSLKPEERQFLKALMEDTHQQFIDAIVAGRKLDEAKVRSLADGRIFTGKQAKDLGLVDELGSLEYAIDYAAKLADLKEKPKGIYPEREKFGFFGKLAEGAMQMRQGLHVLYQMRP